MRCEMDASGPPPPQMTYPSMRPPVKKSAAPIVGGVLIILPALGYMFLGVVIATIGLGFLTPLFDLIPWIANIVMTCAVAFLILGIIALLGGVCAIMRRFWVLALVGGVLTLPSFFGLIGLILVAISKNEFE